MQLRVLAVALLLFACRPQSSGAPPAAHDSFYASTFSRTATPAEQTALGRTLFHSETLSASGRVSCATCHDPRFAYGPPNDLPAQFGGKSGTEQGLRAVPSLRYLHRVPRFSEHYEESDGNGVDQGPTGGFGWDGRAETPHEQARLPLFSPLEMANESDDALASRVRASTLASEIARVDGPEALASSASIVKAVLFALETFEQDPQEFAPYSSKFDEFLRGRVALSPAEERGRKLFEAPSKGNCASCHPNGVMNGSFPAFSDYGFAALGVPRNPELAANRNRAFFDLGLCGPLRTDLASRRELCGLFRVPTLRNVVLRRRFFHNGAFRDLREVVRFYVERDVHPERWYPHGRFDDLPPDVRKNVNREPPFGTTAPALSAREIDDVVAYLKTLTDEAPTSRSR